MIERISLELTNQCSKRCWFCYNHSNPLGSTLWQVDEVVALLTDCAHHGVRSVSLGGGEPLEYAGVYDVLAQLEGVMFRSLTTHGLALDHGALEPLVAARPDKVHVSVHFPEKDTEVERVIRHVQLLTDHGIRAGVNLLVSNQQLGAAAQAAARLRQAGITNDRIIYLPMRGRNTPTPSEVARVAGDATRSLDEKASAFQSMTCLNECGRSERFCSIRWDKTVAWCSYTETRRALESLDHAGLMRAMDGLGLTYCGDDYVPLTWDSTEQGSQANKAEGKLQPCSVAEDEEDFPAAHSMDTDWFATDADGHVALMESGEPGAVPKVIEEALDFDWNWREFSALVNPVGAKSRVMMDYDDMIARGPGQIYKALKYKQPLDTPLAKRVTTTDALRAEESKASQNPDAWKILGWGKPEHQTCSAICWLRDESIYDALEALSAMNTLSAIRRLPVQIRIFVLVEWMPGEYLYKLLDKGVILAMEVFPAFNCSPPIERFGCYRYQCKDYNAGPYDRLIIPRKPVLVSQLPPNAQTVCNHVNFNSLRFSDTPRIQPAEHLPCSGWGSEATWTDLQGITHRFDETT